MLLIFGLSFGASFYMTVRTVFFGREVEVPDIVNMPVEEAREALGRSELYLETASERYDDRIEKGRVQSQDPPAGATIKKDRKVRVTISLGPLEVPIPEVRGQTLRTAKITLQHSGIPAGRATFTHATDAPADTVLAQDPLPTDDSKADVPQGPGPRGEGAVDMLVSLGPATSSYVMPDLTDHSLAQVRAFADRAGLRLGAVRREPAGRAARGLVVRQYPKAGYRIGRQDIISLVLGE